MQNFWQSHRDRFVLYTVQNKRSQKKSSSAPQTIQAENLQLRLHNWAASTLELDTWTLYQSCPEKPNVSNILPPRRAALPTYSHVSSCSCSYCDVRRGDLWPHGTQVSCELGKHSSCLSWGRSAQRHAKRNLGLEQTNPEYVPHILYNLLAIFSFYKTMVLFWVCIHSGARS